MLIFQAGSLLSIDGNYGPGNYGTPSSFVPQYIYFNQGRPNSFIKTGTRQYQFRIYLKNKSTEVLTPTTYDIDFDSELPPQWNYLYIPDSSSNFIALGSFGAATPPQSISISSSAYNTIFMSGANNFPNSSSPYADTSLNTPFPNLSLYGLHVNYGFDLSGSRDSGSKQVEIPPLPYTNFDVSYESDDITNNNWGYTQLFSSFSTVDASLQFIVPTNKIIFPGYRYDVSGYYMRLSSDLSYNVYTTNYPIPTPYPSVTISPPSRNSVSTDYTSMLGGAGQSTFYTNSDLALVSGAAYIIASAYPKNQSNIITNIYFFSQTSVYKLENSAVDYKLINKKDANESTSLGTDLVSTNLCRFVLSTTSPPVTTLNSAYRIGFTGNDTVDTPSNSFFEMSVAESKDATDLPGGTTVEAYRKRGWYLGVDVSDVLIKNMNLVNYPDICNNSYQDWEISLTQDFAGSQPDQTLTYDFRIGRRPTIPVSLSSFSLVLQAPTLVTDFFGLDRPNQTNVATYPLSGLLSGINPDWRPDNTIMEGNLMYASANSATSGNSFDTYEEIWNNAHPATINLSQNVSITLSKLKENAYHYSRDRNFTPQFYVDGTYYNNVTLTPSSFASTKLPISFGGSPLWWDFTYSDFNYTVKAPGTGEYPTNYSTYSVNYNHANTITDHQLMWCNGGFTSGNYTTLAYNNPYINYSSYYGISTVDYSTKNTTGIVKSLSYIAANDDYYSGGNVTITGDYKWVMLTEVKVNANDFGKVLVEDEAGNELTLGTDYLLYIQEIDTYFSAGTTIPSGYANGRSGWKAVQGTWDQGATVQLNNANEAGAYRRNTNTGATAVNNIKYYSPNSGVTSFYRIGLKNGTNKKIGQVTITFGTA